MKVMKGLKLGRQAAVLGFGLMCKLGSGFRYCRYFFGTDFTDYTDYLALEGHGSALSVTCRGI